MRKFLHKKSLPDYFYRLCCCFSMSVAFKTNHPSIDQPKYARARERESEKTPSPQHNSLVDDDQFDTLPFGFICFSLTLTLYWGFVGRFMQQYRYSEIIVCGFCLSVLVVALVVVVGSLRCSRALCQMGCIMSWDICWLQLLGLKTFHKSEMGWHLEGFL